MEANKNIPAVTKHRSKLLDIAKCENVLQSDSSAVTDKDLQLHQVPEDRGCIADGDSWCLEDIHTTDPKIEVLALKALIVRKDKEYEEMQKCKKVLQEKVDQLGLFLKRYERLDEARTSCNMKNKPSLERRVEEMIQEKNDVVIRLDQVEHNEVLEQLRISNEDLSQECLQLEEKLNETVNALAGVEEQMESLAAAKLRETENCNNLACELALAQAKALHLEQLAHAQVGRMMSETSSSRPSGEVKQSSSLLTEPIVKESFSSRSSSSVKQNSCLLRESIGKENSTSRPSGSVRQNSCLLRESISKENSSSRPSGSVRFSFLGCEEKDFLKDIVEHEKKCPTKESCLVNLTPENAIDTLLMIDKMKDAFKLEHRHQVLDYIHKERDQVIETKDWKMFVSTYPHLIAEIIMHCL